MRTNCFAMIALLLLPLLEACGASDLTTNVVYICDQASGERTLMQVKVASNSDQDIELRSVLETDSKVGDDVTHLIEANAAYNIRQIDADGHTYVVRVYRGNEEIETAIFGPDNRKCQNDDAIR